MTKLIVVKFHKHYKNYVPGDIAGFNEADVKPIINVTKVKVEGKMQSFGPYAKKHGKPTSTDAVAKKAEARAKEVAKKNAEEQLAKAKAKSAEVNGKDIGPTDGAKKPADKQTPKEDK